MNIEAARDDLARLLDNAKGLVERRNSMPILGNVLLATSEDELVLRSTDLQVTYTGHCHAKVTEPGELCLPAHKLAELVKLMPAENVHLEATGGEAEMSAAQVRYTLASLDPGDFPPAPEAEGVQVIYLDDAAAFRRTIGRVAYAACTDEERPALCGVLLELREDDTGWVLRLVATDGHRLALADMELSAKLVPDLGRGLLLPTKSVSAMHRVLDEGAVTLGLSRALVTLNTNGDLLQALPRGHEFPDYSVVIPMAHEHRALVRRLALLEAIKRVAAVATEKFKALTLNFGPGSLELSAGAPGEAEATEHLEVEWDGGEEVFSLNHRHLREACERLEGDEVILDFRGATDPVKVHTHAEADAGCLAVIVPMVI